MPDFPALAPGLTDLLEQAFKSQLARIQGGIPARVEKYTQATQVCDALPVTMVYDDDELKLLPVLRSVPVIWPGGGGGALTFPLTIGDFVWLQPGMADFDAWHASNSLGQPPATKRRFSLSDVVAHPVISSMAAPLPSTAVSASGPVLSGSMVFLGSSGASKFVGLHQDNCPAATLMATWMTQVETAINILAGGSVTPLSGTFSSAAIAQITASAAKVKAE